MKQYQTEADFVGLLSGILQNASNGSHWYPDIPRFGPTPQYIPDSMFQDNIQVRPGDETARRGLDFDKMDPRERGLGQWAPRPAFMLRPFR